MRIQLLALATLLAPSMPRPVGACGRYPADRGAHALDAVFSTDVTPPTKPKVSAEAWEQGESSGCGGTNSKCGTPALVYLNIVTTDDRATPDRIGYKLAIKGGSPPAGLVLPDGALRAEVDLDGIGELGLRYDNGASGWSFDLEITAVDLNGNESEPVTVTIDAPP